MDITQTASSGWLMTDTASQEFTSNTTYIADDTKRWIKFGVSLSVSMLIIVNNYFSIMGWMGVQHIALATRIFLINLSVSDLLVGVVACAPSVYPAIQGTWPYGNIWCQVSGIMHGSSCAVSIWSISLVGLDRFFAVTWPLRYANKVTKCRCICIVCGLWTCALVTFIAPCFTKTDFIYYKFNVHNSMCGLYWEYKLFCVATTLYIPILCGGILIYTSIKVTKALRLSTNFRKGSTGPRTTRTHLLNQKALKVIVATSIIYFLLWGPYVMLVSTESFMPSVVVPEWLTFGTLWLANSNSGVNVFVYSLTNSYFRAHLFHLILPCQGKDDVREADAGSNPRVLSRGQSLFQLHLGIEGEQNTA